MNRTVSARVSALALAAAALVALAGCAGDSAPAATDSPVATSAPTATVSAADCAGVFVTVQYGILGGNRSDACVETSAPITAAAALKAAHFRTEGTAKYGDMVVCRVNGAPAASRPFTVPGQQPYTEKCRDMPAAFAYWAMWVRPSATGTWGYAMSGVAMQQLKPGETLGLKFTTGTDTTPPQD